MITKFLSVSVRSNQENSGYRQKRRSQYLYMEKHPLSTLDNYGMIHRISRYTTSLREGTLSIVDGTGMTHGLGVSFSSCRSSSPRTVCLITAQMSCKRTGRGQIEHDGCNDRNLTVALCLKLRRSRRLLNEASLSVTGQKQR